MLSKIWFNNYVHSSNKINCIVLISFTKSWVKKRIDLSVFADIFNDDAIYIWCRGCNSDMWLFATRRDNRHQPLYILYLKFMCGPKEHAHLSLILLIIHQNRNTKNPQYIYKDYLFEMCLWFCLLKNIKKINTSFGIVTYY